MLWAQITLLVLTAINLLLSANLHGKTTPAKRNFWVALPLYGAEFFVLYNAGAFSRIFHH